jgi:hypothetical protein
MVNTYWKLGCKKFFGIRNLEASEIVIGLPRSKLVIADIK